MCKGRGVLLTVSYSTDGDLLLCSRIFVPFLLFTRALLLSAFLSCSCRPAGQGGTFKPRWPQICMDSAAGDADSGFVEGRVVILSSAVGGEISRSVRRNLSCAMTRAFTPSMGLPPHMHSSLVLAPKQGRYQEHLSPMGVTSVARACNKN